MATSQLGPEERLCPGGAGEWGAGRWEGQTHDLQHLPLSLMSILPSWPIDFKLPMGSHELRAGKTRAHGSASHGLCS